MDAPSSSPGPENAPAKPASLVERLSDVYVVPGEVFDGIKNAPVRTSNWLTPLVLVCLAAICYTMVAFSQPSVALAMKEARVKAMQKKVAAGQYTQAQADQMMTASESFLIPGVMAVFAVGVSVIGFFVLGAALWGGVKVASEVKVPYMKIIEVCGLASMIDVAQKIIRTPLVLWKQNLLATVSPTLFLDHPDMTKRGDMFLSMVDAVDIWWLVVLSVGVSKVASISYGRAALLTFGVWYGFRVIAALMTTS
jgi:hypothetical protein